MPALDPAYAGIRTHLAARLRYLREFAGLNQREFARFMGVTYQMIQVWEETGSYRAELLPRMAQVLDCSIAAFYDTDTYGRPTRATRSVDRLIQDAVRPLTQDQRDALIVFVRAMTAAEEPAPPATESGTWTAATVDRQD